MDWSSPDGRTYNQIDHILISKRNASSVMNVRTYRGADCDSDHFLVCMRYRDRIMSRGKSSGQKAHLEKFKTPETTIDYRNKIKEALNLCYKETCNTGCATGDTVEETWKIIKEVIINTGKEVLGPRPKKPRNEWFDQECVEKIEARNKTRKNYLNRPTRMRREEYERARSEVKRIIRSKKRKYLTLNNIVLQMEQDFKTNRSKKAYKAVNLFRKGYNPIAFICKKEGQLITGKEEVLSRWRDHFERLFIPDLTQRDDRPVNARSDECDNLEGLPTIMEIREAVQKLKNNKAPGIDNISAELIKHGGEALLIKLQLLFDEIWKTEKIPEDWQASIIHPIYKKGDKLVCENYRGISLLNTAYKIFTSIVKERLEPYAEEILGDYEAGFKRSRSTSDQLFVVRQIAEKFWEFNIDLYHIFVDFKQAYDSISNSISREICYTRSFGNFVSHRN